MKKVLYTVLFWSVVLSSLSIAQVQLKFVTVNGYGNNLYIDNFTVGNQFNLDVGVSAINNIKADTSYATSVSPFSIAPNVSIINIGKQNITSAFNVTMTVTPGGYSSTKSVASLNSGQSYTVIFDNLTITPGQAINISIVTSLTGDENPANNTLNQYTMIFPGTYRTVLLEEWTSSTCGPCASNNPTVDAFIAARFDSLVAIKYHMNWPAPGNDPMYLYNPTQATDRRSYYGVNSVPTVIMDGVVNPSYPYSTPTSLPGAFYPRKAVGSPLSVTVTDTRIPGDTIKADITVQVFSPLNAGQYYLRVHAVERAIHYPTAPGTNGEKDFFDVFRKAYPNSLGTPVPTSVGTYQFTIKYPLDMAVWVDSMIYTAAFVQNDITKEVLNSGKGRNIVSDNITIEDIKGFVEKANIAPDMISLESPLTVLSNIEGVNSIFGYELFESNFPASGWTLKNPDGGLTFAQFTGANGPTIGGSKSVKVDFYSYSTTGASDTLISRQYSGVDLIDSVKFDFAYAQYSASYVDRLVVKLSVDGGLTYPHTIFDRSGSSLATAPTTTNPFVPTASQWQTFSFPLAGVIPVELTSFIAQVIGNDVTLKWSTATEVNNLGFEVQKRVSGDYVAIGFIDGNGTTTDPRDYSFTDLDLHGGSYQYRLKQVDYNGNFEYSEVVNVDIQGINNFTLNQNYPNPFNPLTRIDFSLPVESKVTLKVFNLLGEEVTTLINGNMTGGNHHIDFNALNLNSGIYLYKIEAVGIDGKSFTSVKKMTLIK